MSNGLGVVLVIREALWLKTGNPLDHQMARFWTKVFALTFALGVATGIVMELQFGTNWAAYSRFVGDVMGGLPLRTAGFPLATRQRKSSCLQVSNSLPFSAWAR